MSFAGLRAADWVALLAALALLLVTAGAPLALGLLGVLAFACAVAVRAEEEGTELREGDPAPAP